MGASLVVAIRRASPPASSRRSTGTRSLDYFITTLAFFGQSMPVFWFALMMQLVFAVHGIPLPFGYMIQLPSAGIVE